METIKKAFTEMTINVGAFIAACLIFCAAIVAFVFAIVSHINLFKYGIIVRPIICDILITYLVFYIIEVIKNRKKV